MSRPASIQYYPRLSSARGKPVVKILSMTTLRELARLSLPIVVSQGAFAVMVFTDRWFMSQIDAAHIAAALGGGVAAFFCMSFFIGLISYGNALVAQYYGSGQRQKCPRVVAQGLFIALASVPFLVLAALGAGSAFAWLGHEATQVRLERAYFYTLMGGSLFHLVKACLASYFVGIGRTRVVMLVDLVGVAINVPLTWLLVFGHAGLPALGIVGAGLGTVVANVVTIVLFTRFFLEPNHSRQFGVSGFLRLDSGIMRRYLRLGAPSALENFMNTATFNVFLLMFQSYGIVQGAAMAIVFNWDMLSFVPMAGLGIGVMSLIGRFVGAGDMQRANQVISAGLILALGYSGVLAVLFLVFRFELIEVFATGEANFAEIREMAGLMMFGLVTYMLADAVILIAGGTLRGAGDTRWVMLVSTGLHLLMLAAQVFVIRIWQLEALVAWWVFVAMLLCIAACYLTRLVGGRWRRPERLARVMEER
jgi:MATE family multidrug resistance protein